MRSCLGPGVRHVASDDFGIDLQECFADVAGEGEIVVRVSGPVIIVKDSADPARFVAVLEKEILVAPRLVLFVGRGRRVEIAGLFHRRMERNAVRVRPGSGVDRAPGSDRPRRRTTASSSPRTGCSCARSARWDSTDGRSTTRRRPKNVGRDRSLGSGREIPARTRRTPSICERRLSRTRDPASST